VGKLSFANFNFGERFLNRSNSFRLGHSLLSQFRQQDTPATRAQLKAIPNERKSERTIVQVTEFATAGQRGLDCLGGMAGPSEPALEFSPAAGPVCQQSKRGLKR
jgi:hypothetical protein